jgi:tetratricopeptide (TPR) repeat protein
LLAKRIANQGKWENATESDKQVALEIAQEMDGLPLALDQAGAFIEEMMLSLVEYLNLYRQEGAKLLEERGELATDDHPSVMVTFRLAFTKVQERSPAAADLLRICAFLAPDDIPEEIFTAGASVLAEPLKTAATNALDFAKAVREAGRFSLIERKSTNQTLNIHRLVQEVLRSEMEEVSTREGWLEQIIKTVNQVFPDIDFKNWSLCDRLLTHSVKLYEFLNIYSLNPPAAAQLFNQAGRYLKERGQYLIAESLLLKSITIYKNQFGIEHIIVAMVLNNLGELYRAQGCYDKAGSQYNQSLLICEKYLNSDHSIFCTILNNLAGLYEFQGRYEIAEKYYKRALNILKKYANLDDIRIAGIFNNIGNLNLYLNKYEKAEWYLLKSLALREKYLVSDDPSLAQSFNNLAEFYCTREKYEQAKPFCKKALDIRKKHLGSKHPDFATSLCILAKISYVEGKKETSIKLYLEALSIQRQALDKNHPRIADTLNQLGAIYLNEKKYAKAEEYLFESLKIIEQHPIQDFHRIAVILMQLAVLYDNYKNRIAAESFDSKKIFIHEAELYYLKSLFICSQNLGETHPTTMAASMNFQGFISQAIDEGWENQLSNHPATQILIKQFQAEADAG